MQMVDRALAAEHSGLNGTVYIDTRGIHAPPTLLCTAAYDQNMRNLAGLFRRVTSYPVVLEETDRTFNQPGEAPDVAVYVGWYRLRAYEDAFTFNPGALGYHIASAEAVMCMPHKSGAGARTPWSVALQPHFGPKTNRTSMPSHCLASSLGSC